MAALAFVLGNVMILRLPTLEFAIPVSLLLPVALFGLTRPGSRTISAACLGIVTGIIGVHHELQRRLGDDWHGTQLVVQARVDELPRSNEGVTRFVVTVESDPLVNRRLLVYLYRHSDIRIRAGERWILPLRLATPRGSQNYDLFDYEQWMFVKRFHGRGTITDTTAMYRVENVAGIGRLRQTVSDRLAMVERGPGLATFAALTLGDTGRLNPDDWAVLNATGTTHLLIVSGLHVGLIAGLVHWLCRRLGLRSYYTGVFTVMAAASYALLSGWGLPVQRALIMCAVVVGAANLARQIPVFSQFFIALVVVLLLDPLASLASGFWLSFGAVFVLLYALTGRSEVTNRLRRVSDVACAAQWVVFVGLMPVLGFMTGEVSLVSIGVNIIAIPVVGLMIVPLSLLGLGLAFVFAPLGSWILALTSIIVKQLWEGLVLVASMDLSLAAPGKHPVYLAISLLGVLIVLSPPGFIHRLPGLLALLALFNPVTKPGEGDLWVTFLDVGQGLSVVLETSEGMVVYDTGPAMGKRFSAAKQTVIPTIARRGYRHLETLVISHGDNDHAGGEQDVRAALLVRDVIRFGQCDRSWTIGGVDFFTFSLLDSSQVTRGHNNASCLLLVRAQGHWMLLTGDIEQSAEQQLVQLRLPWVEVMSSPHHGSITSSSPALLNSLRPELIIVSAGYRNRFSHPDPRVLARYQQRAIRVLGTAEEGAVRVRFTGNTVDVVSARNASRAIWRSSDGYSRAEY